MQSKLSDLWEKHRFLIICAATYVIVFIVSCFYNPWHYTTENYWLSVDIDNRFFDKIPLKFLGFGIADVSECVDNGVGILCGFIAYAAVLADYLIKKYYESKEDVEKFEIFFSCYLCDNIIFYIMSILVKPFENVEMETAIFEFIGMPFDIFDSAIAIIPIIIWILVCLFIILPLFIFAVPPALVTYIYCFGYIVIYKLCTNLIEAINGKIMQNGESLFLELIMFILTSLIIIALNLLLLKIFDIIRGWSLKPAKVYINFMKKVFQKFQSRR